MASYGHDAALLDPEEENTGMVDKETQIKVLIEENSRLLKVRRSAGSITATHLLTSLRARAQLLREARSNPTALPTTTVATHNGVGTSPRSIASS